jgi:hypothetical protein
VAHRRRKGADFQRNLNPVWASRGRLTQRIWPKPPVRRAQRCQSGTIRAPRCPFSLYVRSGSRRSPGRSSNRIAVVPRRKRLPSRHDAQDAPVAATIVSLATTPSQISVLCRWGAEVGSAAAVSTMYKLRPPLDAKIHPVFVSSSDEDATQRLRARVKGLIEDVINPQLRYAYPEAGVQLALDTWDRAAAQQVAEDQTVNEIFVEQVHASALTIGLLLDEVRPGTEEELVAAITDPKVQVAVHVFERVGDPPEHRARDVVDFLREHGAKIFVDDRCGQPDGDQAWLSLIRTLLNFTFTAMGDNDPRRSTTSGPEVR